MTAVPKEAEWLVAKRVPKGMALKSVPVPRRYEAADVDEIWEQGLENCVRKYGKDFWEAAARGLAPFFAGSAGCGKTYAASVLAKAIHHVHRIEVTWCNCAEELVWFDREAFSPAVAARLQELKSAPFVVLDDFTQFTDGRQLNTLCEIGSARYNGMLPTLWTGNVAISKTSTAELESAVGAMLSRRIMEMSEGYRVMVQPG